MTLALLICGTLSLAISSLVCAYFAMLTFVGIASRKRTAKPLGAAMHRFTILIPAHNEELLIGDTLRSCLELDYPEDRFNICVVADNCRDRTADLARAAGVRCLARHDDQHPGKGCALAWAIPIVLSGECDAIVVLDADCCIDRDALRVFDSHLCDGAKAIQANDVASNPDDSSISYALTVANTLENDMFYFPKSLLGLSVFLRGTGFVLHRDILERYPWQAGSAVEDSEYSATLMRNHVSIRFAAEVQIASPFPADYEQMSIQRTRWVGGASWWARNHGWHYLFRGLLQRQWKLLDAGWTSLITIRAFVLLQLFVTSALALSAIWLAPSTWSWVLCLGSLGAIAVHALYVCVGIAVVGLTRRRIALLCSLPMIVFRHLVISLGAIFRSHHAWRRTPRTGEARA